MAGASNGGGSAKIHVKTCIPVTCHVYPERGKPFCIETLRGKMSLRSCLFVVLAGSLQPATAGTNTIGKKFLAENGKKPGVVTLRSGLQYKVLLDGDGEKHPNVGTDCSCHYEGRTAQEWSKRSQRKEIRLVL